MEIGKAELLGFTSFQDDRVSLKSKGEIHKDAKPLQVFVRQQCTLLRFDISLAFASLQVLKAVRLVCTEVLCAMFACLRCHECHDAMFVCRMVSMVLPSPADQDQLHRADRWQSVPWRSISHCDTLLNSEV